MITGFSTRTGWRDSRRHISSLLSMMIVEEYVCIVMRETRVYAPADKKLYFSGLLLFHDKNGHGFQWFLLR